MTRGQRIVTPAPRSLDRKPTVVTQWISNGLPEALSFYNRNQAYKTRLIPSTILAPKIIGNPL